MLCILLKRHPRILKFASKYLDGDSNFKIEALNQSINLIILSYRVLWGGGGYFEVPRYILRCPVETIWAIKYLYDQKKCPSLRP